MEYSYGRILSHECGECIIHHGLLFDKERKYYEWNTHHRVKSVGPEIKTVKRRIFKDSKNFKMNYSELEKRRQYNWNCETSIEINLDPISEKHLNCFLVYE